MVHVTERIRRVFVRPSMKGQRTCIMMHSFLTTPSLFPFSLPLPSAPHLSPQFWALSEHSGVCNLRGKQDDQEGNFVFFLLNFLYPSWHPTSLCPLCVSSALSSHPPFCSFAFFSSVSPAVSDSSLPVYHVCFML